MKILATGGAGFIGSHFVELALRTSNAELVCLDNFNTYYDPRLKRANAAAWVGNPRVSLVEADFCDYDAVDRLFAAEQFTHVMHLGAYPGVRWSVANARVYQQTNVGGTLNLLEAARKYPVERFALISSSTVYGRGAGVPFREDAPLGVPQSPYGATKRAAELLGLCYQELHGVPVVCLRPFSVYGPRLRPDLALTIFTDAILADKPITLYGDGSIRRDFTHVSDICAGLWASLTAATVVGETINLGHSEPIEMRRVIELLAAAAGKQAIVKHEPGRPEDLPITFADLAKAERLLGYKPRVEFEAGVREFVEWRKRGG